LSSRSRHLGGFNIEWNCFWENVWKRPLKQGTLKSNSKVGDWPPDNNIAECQMTNSRLSNEISLKFSCFISNYKSELDFPGIKQLAPPRLKYH
jgi:hypothetical protein